MIELHNLHLSYPLANGSLDVLRGAEASIRQGESVAVTGPSGSGKTTLLLLLAGLEGPDAGSVSIGGTDLSTLDADGLADLRRDRLGIIFQSFHLIPSLTALGNVSLPLDIAGNKDARTSAQNILERVGLAERAGHYPSQLSGGEQQRVAIARALVHRPAVLLADEPTGNLDTHTGSTIVELLFQLNREFGTTLVLVTHDTEIAGMCDRNLRLQQGQLR
ncbi:MAG: ABC transporter ATP-binding protein [Pseudomonadota bacterium]